jgi:hypothetical protein
MDFGGRTGESRSKIERGERKMGEERQREDASIEGEWG